MSGLLQRVRGARVEVAGEIVGAVALESVGGLLQVGQVLFRQPASIVAGMVAAAELSSSACGRTMGLFCGGAARVDLPQMASAIQLAPTRSTAVPRTTRSLRWLKLAQTSAI